MTVEMTVTQYQRGESPRREKTKIIPDTPDLGDEELRVFEERQRNELNGVGIVDLVTGPDFTLVIYNEREIESLSVSGQDVDVTQYVPSRENGIRDFTFSKGKVTLKRSDGRDVGFEHHSLRRREY